MYSLIFVFLFENSIDLIGISIPVVTITLILAGSFFSSIPSEFGIRSAGKTNGVVSISETYFGLPIISISSHSDGVVVDPVVDVIFVVCLVGPSS